jgi:hypothetical protein
MTQASIHDPDTLSRIVMLTFGRMDHGGPYWCYVAIKPSRYEAYRQAMASMSYNMQNFDKDNYGEVIVSGEGDRPPSEITKKVAKMFNVPIREFFKDDKPDETVRKHFDLLAKESNNA